MNSEKPLQVNNHRFFRKARYGADRFVLIRRDKVHYVEAGQGDPVLLISGSQSSSRVWARLMPLLEGQYRLLALDYPAFDEAHTTRQLEEAIREQADLIASMIRQLKLGKVNLIGGSLGAAVAFNLAARYPDLIERVVAVSGHIGAPPDKAAAAGAAASASASGPATGLTRKSAKTDTNRLEEEAKVVSCPILYLYGTKAHSRELPLAHNLEFLQKNHPQAWIVALEGGIFEIALNNPPEIANLLLDFLKYKPGLKIG